MEYQFVSFPRSRIFPFPSNYPFVELKSFRIISNDLSNRKGEKHLDLRAVTRRDVIIFPRIKFNHRLFFLTSYGVLSHFSNKSFAQREKFDRDFASSAPCSGNGFSAKTNSKAVNPYGSASCLLMGHRGE